MRNADKGEQETTSPESVSTPTSIRVPPPSQNPTFADTIAHGNHGMTAPEDNPEASVATPKEKRPDVLRKLRKAYKVHNTIDAEMLFDVLDDLYGHGR